MENTNNIITVCTSINIDNYDEYLTIANYPTSDKIYSIITNNNEISDDFNLQFSIIFKSTHKIERYINLINAVINKEGNQIILYSNNEEILKFIKPLLPPNRIIDQCSEIINDYNKELK